MPPRLRALARPRKRPPELIARCSQPPEPANVITETVGNDGSNRPGCSPGSPLQAEAAGIIREAQAFCRQYGSPEELAKYPVASLVLRLAHALKESAAENESLRITDDEREALIELCEWRKKHPYPVMWMVGLVNLLHRHTPGSVHPWKPKPPT